MFPLSWKYIHLNKVKFLPAARLNKETLIDKCYSVLVLQYVHLYDNEVVIII